MSTVDSRDKQVVTEFAQQMHLLARRAERQVRWRAVLVSLSAVVLLALVMAGADWWWRRDEWGLRWLTWIGLILFAAYVFQQWLRPVLQLRIAPMDVARWLEKRQPQWAGQLGTALELSEADASDNRLGSQQFRQAALAAWQQQAPMPVWSELINSAALVRSAIAFAGLMGAITIAWLMWPDHTATAMGRLVMPWSDRRWPSQDQLEFLNLPTAAAMDSSLQLEIVDRRPPLPAEVVVQVRTAEQSDQMPMLLKARSIGDLAIVNLPPLNQSVQVRALGGDQTESPWKTIDVVAVPKWSRYHFDVRPPEYLRASTAAWQRLSTEFDASGGYRLVGQRIQVVQGSRVGFIGQLDNPVEQVTADLSFGSGTAKEIERELPAWPIHLESDRRTVRMGNCDAADSLLESSISWRFVLTTEHHLPLPMPGDWEIEVLPDSPPEVILEPPQLRSLAVGAPLRIRGLARDDWGLTRIVAKMRVSSAPEMQLEREMALNEVGQLQSAIDVSWNYAPELASRGIEIQSQDQITLWLEATDLRGQVVQSQEERLSIESRQHQLDKIADRRELISGRLNELLSSQQAAQRLTVQLEQQIQSVPVGQSQADVASNVAGMQQSIRSQLVETNSSLRQELDRQLSLLDENQLQNSGLGSELLALRESLAALGAGAAADANQSATQLATDMSKTIGNRVDAGLQSELQRLAESQSQMIEQLQSLTQAINDSEQLSRQRESLLDLAKKHQDLTQTTESLNLQAVQHPDRISQTQLQTAAELQAAIATELEKWLATQLSPDQTRATDGLSQQLDSAARALAKSQVVEQMRAAANGLRSNQLGSAVTQQQFAQRALQQAIDELIQSQAGELLDSLAERDQALQQFSQVAEELSEQQNELTRQLADTATLDLSEWANRQSAVENATRQAAAAFASDPTLDSQFADAQQSQRDAATAAESSDLPQAREASQQAAKQLQQLAETVRQEAEQANQQHQQQQLFELIAKLAQLVEQQSAVMPSYEQLARLQQSPLPPDFDQLLKRLLEMQTVVREGVQEALDGSDQLPAYQWVLQEARADLTRALAAAERKRLQPDALDSAQQAHQKLQIAYQSLQPDTTQTPDDADDSDQQENQSEQAAEQERLPSVASLKLVRGLQLDLQQQTEAATSMEPAQQPARLAELTTQQRQLMELLQKLIAQAQAE